MTLAARWRVRAVGLCREPFLPWVSGYRMTIGPCSISFDVGNLWVEVWGCRNDQRRWSVLHVMSRSWFDRLWRWDQKGLYMSFLDRIPAPSDGRSGLMPCTDEKFQKSFPAVAEFLTVSVLPTGEIRTPSSFTVFWEEGVFKICLAERDRGLTLWATGETFQDALRCLEDRLKSPKPEWRKQRPQGRKKG